MYDSFIKGLPAGASKEPIILDNDDFDTDTDNNGEDNGNYDYDQDES